MPSFLFSSLIHLHINEVIYGPHFSLPPSLLHFSSNVINIKSSDKASFLLSLPPSLTSLSLRHFTLKGNLSKFPPSLTHLHLAVVDIDSLPSSILSLSVYRSDPINRFPPLLSSFIVECGEIILNCHLPASLKTFEFHLIPPSLPSVFLPLLTHLKCDDSSHFVSLPDTLTHLKIPILPKNHSFPLLTHLKVHYHTSPTFPPNLTHLEIGTLGKKDHYSKRSILSFSFPSPSKITHLIVGGCKISSLPPLLEHLTLRYSFTFPLPPLPLTLTHLTMHLKVNQILPSLPPTLRSLVFPFNGRYNDPLPLLPSSLHYLYLPNNYYQPLPNIPPSLLWFQCMVLFNYYYFALFFYSFFNIKICR